MTGWSALAVSLVLLVVNGFFVAVEFALVGSRRTKIEEMAAGGSARARVALAASSELSLQLAGSQLGVTVASLALGLIAEPAMADALQPLADAAHLPARLGHGVAGVLGLMLVVFAHLVIGELVPKNLAMADPERALLWVSRPTRVYLAVFRPLIRALNALGRLGVRALGVEPREELSSVPTAGELTVMLQASRDEGLIEDSAHELLTGVLDFGERKVASVMVPRGLVRSLPSGTTVAEAEAVVVETGHSRLPVEGAGGLDDVRGFVHAKDLLTLNPGAADRPVPLRLVRRMLVVPRDRSLEDLLLAMRSARVHFALVTEADGATAGIATLEDLLEELVGDILDESDPDDRV